MTGLEASAAVKAGTTITQNLAIFGVFSRTSGYIFYHQTKKAKAKSEAGRVFSLASQLIRDLPAGQGFNETSAQWLREVRELLRKWGRLVENMNADWKQLGAHIDRLERANWYDIAGTPEDFTGNSKIGSWNFHKIGRTSAKVTEEALRLKERHSDKGELNGGDPIKVYKPAEGCCEFPNMENMKKFISFHCRAETMDRIRSSIQNHPTSFTQIYGAAGIGKTTMMVEIAKQIGHKFKRVVYVEVSRSPNIFQIQKKIASQLGVPLAGTNEDVARRAETLRGVISNTGDSTEKVLLVLDDVWEHLSIQQIGIPTGEKVRVLIGTRMSDLQLQDGDDKIPVGLLTGEDPWEFFKGAAELKDTDEVVYTAKKVAEECFGLPLALAVIGSTLSGEKEESTWQNTLAYLKKSQAEKVRGVEENLWRIIKYSYEHLINDKIATNIFRLCCLFPENHDIPEEDLNRYLIAEDAELSSIDFDSSIHRLLKCHLLQSSVKSGFVRMHAVVRDVAVYITKEEDCAFINCGTANTKTELSEEIVTSKKTVSVMGSNIKETVGFPKYTMVARGASYIREKFAEKAECAKIQILLLRGNTGLDQLPGSFFGRMGDLTVLDLSDSAIKGLPPSMDKLNKVRTLLLNGCKDLKRVDMIAKLRGLRVLSLRESALTSLPTGMSNLVDLIVLELSPATTCKIEEGFFRGLPKIQVLFLASESLLERTFHEITKLEHIRDLRLYVNNIVPSSTAFDAVQTRSIWSEFTFYCDLTYRTMSRKKNLHIKDLVTANGGVKLLLQEAEHLIIEKCFVATQGIYSDLTAATGVSIFTKTKILHLKNCGKIQYLSSGSSSQWEELEELELTGLDEFDGICKDTVSAVSFPIVREITVRLCEKINCVIPDNVLQKVHKTLQKITVIGCVKVESIFDTQAEYSGLFSVLVSIHLRGLTMLQTIWKGSPPQGTFSNLMELILIDCAELVCAFTHSLPAMLTSLQKLTVENNPKMEAIVGWDGRADLHKRTFPSVTHLSIQKLPNLKHFHISDIDLDWPLLVQLRLGGCDGLTRFPIGQASAPYMTLVHVTSKTDQSRQWYKELDKVKTAAHFKICVPCPSI